MKRGDGLSKVNEKRMWGHIFKFSKKYIPWIALSIISTLIFTYSNVYTSDLLKKIIDMVVKNKFQSINSYIVIGLIMFMLGIAAKYFFRYAIGRYGNNVIRDVRNATVEYVHKLPPDYTMKNKVGEILAKLSGDASVVQDFMANEFINLIYLPLMLLGFAIYLMYLNTTLFVASFILLPILIPYSIKLLVPIKKSQYEYVSYLGKTNNNVQNSINGIAILKAYNLEAEMSRRYNESVMTATNIAFNNDKREYRVAPIQIIVGVLPGTICVVFGGYLCLQGKMTVGELVSFLNIFALFTEPVQGLYRVIIHSKFAMASVERLFSILDEEPEKSGNTVLNKEDYDNNDSIIEFENVEFSYDKDNSVLKNVSLVVPKGKSIALVGASGSGKTTMLKLMCKIYESQNGCIKICGKDIKELEVESLRDSISYVTQSSFLFPFSVKENIIIGNPKASMEEIIDAAKKANAHNFIMELPQGYDTFVGEGGAKLSGGQVQRISIARAILKNAPILLLDEATSALDTQSEALVKEAFDNLKKEKTIVVVAHRLSTIEDADEIVVLDNGSIVEKGSHKELIGNDSAYAKLHLSVQGEGVSA